MERQELEKKLKEIQKRKESRESYLVGIHFDDGGYQETMRERFRYSMIGGSDPIQDLADALQDDVEEEIWRSVKQDVRNDLLSQIIQDALGEVDYEYIASFFVDMFLKEEG